MKNQQYMIVFRGDIEFGYQLQDVRSHLRKLFNVSDARIDRLFIGKPVSLKRQLTLEDAQRYQMLLKKAGASVAIEPEGASKNQQESPQLPDASAAVDGSSQEWQLAPVGSQLSDDRSEALVDQHDIDIHHLNIMPQEGPLLKDSERQPSPGLSVDVEALDWELTPFGKSLLKASEKKEFIPADIDTSSLSIADVGSDLLKEEEKASMHVADINTDHIHLSASENKAKT